MLWAVNPAPLSAAPSSSASALAPALPARFAFIIGAMKSGTSSLNKYLAEHPQIAPTRSPRPGYFALPEARARGEAWYLGLWDWDPGRHRVALEDSPYYAKLPFLPGVPQAIERFASEHAVDVRFIYLMREPLERIESHFRHYAQYYPWKLLLHRAEVLREAIAFSRYTMQLAPWIERFGRERVLLLRFDDLERDRRAVIQRVCRFLEVDAEHAFAGLDKVHHASMRRQLWFLALRRSPILRRAWKRVPTGAKKGVWRPLRPAIERHRPYLTRAERAQAAEQLRADVAELGARYGVDISGWGRA